MGEAPSNTLDTIELLQMLTPDERARLAKECIWRRFAAGEQILDRRDESRDVCLIASGRVRVVNFSISGREVSFDDIEQGKFFGELAAIDGEPRSASILALKPTVIAFMPPSLFERVVSEHPELASAVLRRLAKMVRLATERIMDLTTLGANNRVHAEILRLAKPNLQPDGSATITPIPVHSDIASRVSTTRETVARVLSELARDGLVERRADHLLVCDFQQLEEMVEDVRG